jgi:hypothetical protein
VKEEENDIQLEKRKKKMLKNQIRNQKLDESFTFLKQIDKEKQKKMKQSLIQTQESNTMSSEQSAHLENILDKLRLDDEGDKKKDKKQVTQNNALMIEKKKNFKEDKVPSTSNATNLNQKKSQPPTQIKSQTQTQIKPQVMAADKQGVNVESGDLKRQSSKDLIIYPNTNTGSTTTGTQNQKKVAPP